MDLFAFPGVSSVVVLGALMSCSPSSAVELTNLTPDVTGEGQEVEVTIVGRNLYGSVELEVDTSATPTVRNHWVVQFGSDVLAANRIRWVDSQSLQVRVPSTLMVGTHAVVVTTPNAERLLLRPGLTVVGSLTKMPGDDAGSLNWANGKDASVVTALSVDAGWRPEASLSGDVGVVVDAAADSHLIDAGVLDADASAELLELGALQEALIHRYSFKQVGSAIVDSVGGADGQFIGSTLDGVSGAAEFRGGGEFIDLPNSLISVHSSITLEAWVIWEAPNGGSASGWQRIFDFGSNPAAEGQQGNGLDTHLFVSPRTAGASGTLHFSYRGNGTGSINLNATSPFPTDELKHITVVVDDQANQMALYLDDLQLGTRFLSAQLSNINDENNWLGRSQSIDDPSFEGRIFEFRIYDQALTPSEVSISHQAGPDAALSN